MRKDFKMNKNLENFPMRFRKDDKGRFYGIISKKEKDEKGNWVNKAINVNLSRELQDKLEENKLVMINGKLNPTAYKNKEGAKKYGFEILVDSIEEFDETKLKNTAKLKGFINKHTNKNGKEFYTLSVRSENLNEKQREKAGTSKDFVYNNLIINTNKENVKELSELEGKYIESEGYILINKYNDEITMSYYVKELQEPVKEISDKEKQDYMYKDIEENKEAMREAEKKEPEMEI